ncbi:MAG: TIGR01666 family membrane protein [Candidatus Dactylopiibacterium carminicum]|uniref:TIGR01666 family membrane protein n=1 Tax=Candidatus Dactylopiibacterium carminicum TaxID=857335 RepID=A0A272EP80_9RHOO|nr:YccS family putative transporter [Candidatus Dactylopiibacterium carminicum]KAF7598278.1 TIGR01666 family membrane protein [Candidatus Dactylopiibacterium carminicum]PAS91923.1 MAG: TIGR01666 family membrane protein [Candidatus Dactylopiibacterium carminicum]
MYPVAEQLRRLWVHDKALSSLKVTIALLCVIWASVAWQHHEWLIGLILGVIAAALAETDDRPIGRLRAICAMLASFAVVAFSVQWLFPWPWLFVCGLALSSFSFVMLGALGERYATLSIASLILAIYTMLGLSQHHSQGLPFWHEPALLLSGATLYSAISLLGALFFSQRTPRQSTARVFLALAHYLRLKAALLSPQPGHDTAAQRLQLAEHNARLVGRMNQARQILIAWQQGGRVSAETMRLLKWYFAAQGIHERASSAHHPYAELTTAFARSDVLFRCEHLLRVQADYCELLAGAIVQGEFAPAPQGSAAALEQLRKSLDYLGYNAVPMATELREALDDIGRNLARIDAELQQLANPFAPDEHVDRMLRDANPRSMREMLLRVRLQFSPASSRFRHGLRLALALSAGYGLIHILDLPQGYWVLLTTVFVCQPQYSSTWRRLGERVSGTLLGLLIASAFIAAFAHPAAQLSLLVVAGVAFFAFRAERYLLATASITVLVMLCFNQFGGSYALVLPRLLDTILGSLIAGVAVALVLPDWQGKRLHRAMAGSLRASARYLGEILRQYSQGKRDDLAYRIARRDAHNADAELSSTLAAMLGEPERFRAHARQAYLFLAESHSLLGYISALGAHREQLTAWQHQACIDALATAIQQDLIQLATALEQGTMPDESPSIDMPIPGDAQGAERRLLRQLSLIRQQLPAIRARIGVRNDAAPVQERLQLPR